MALLNLLIFYLQKESLRFILLGDKSSHDVTDMVEGLTFCASVLTGFLGEVVDKPNSLFAVEQGNAQLSSEAFLECRHTDKTSVIEQIIAGSQDLHGQRCTAESYTVDDRGERIPVFCAKPCADCHIEKFRVLEIPEVKCSRLEAVQRRQIAELLDQHPIEFIVCIGEGEGVVDNLDYAHFVSLLLGYLSECTAGRQPFPTVKSSMIAAGNAISPT